MRVAQRKRLGLALLAVALLLFPWVSGNEANIDSAANALAYAMLALGLNVVVGFAGLLDLGYAAFFAIGAYFYGVLSSYQLAPPWEAGWAPLAALGLVQHMPDDTVHFTLSFWLALPLAAGVAALCGAVFGAPTLRLRGDYLAIVTLGFGEIVPIVVRNVPAVTNGAAGLNGIAPPHLPGLSFGVSATPYYYTALAMLAVLLLVSVRLRDGRVGRAWAAIREDEVAAGAMGVDPVRYKLLAFAIGAAFAGMVGVLYVAKLQTATPEMFGFPVSVMVLVMVVLGGMGSVWGVVLGAVLLSLLQSWFLPDLTGWLHALGGALGNAALQRVDLVQGTELIFGVVLVAMMLFRREGLIPATRRQAALSDEAQHAGVGQGRAVGLAVAEAKALRVRGLTVRFGGLVALRGVDLDVPAGSVVAVIGPNGSGKSTLFNAITGLVTASSGSVRLGSEEILGLRPHEVLARGVARTFQNIRVLPGVSVLGNVLLGAHAGLRAGPVGTVLRLPRVRREEARARARALEVMALFGNRLLPRAGQDAGALSYANRRRVEIARALLARPGILLLDEPTAGMNPAETRELAEQVGALRRAGLTILLIEHKLDVVTRLADKVVVLDGGEKLAEGTAEEVRRNPEVLRAYLGRAAAAQVAKEAAPA